MVEPTAPDPDGPRYSRRPLPPYRFVPGESPHPHNDPDGHRFAPPSAPSGWRPESWRELEAWRYGVDLYNRGFFWECHESLEALWLATDRTADPGRFVQGVILVAAACLNECRGAPAAADQARRGVAAIESVGARGGRYMGLSVEPFARETAAFFTGGSSRPASIRLHGEESR